MRRIQVPLTEVPLRALRGVSGRKLPLKGAVPAVMDVAALSSNTVKTPAQSFEPEPKLSPLEPRRLKVERWFRWD